MSEQRLPAMSRRELLMLIGAAAGGVTFMVGRLLGVSVT